MAFGLTLITIDIIHRGKEMDKHCTTCDKKISGANWNKHVKNVHDGVQPSFNKRNEQTLTLN